jgi:hypothetical protein
LAGAFEGTEVFVDVTEASIRGRRMGSGKVRIYSLFPMSGWAEPGQVTFYEGTVTASLMPVPERAWWRDD